MCVRRPRGLMPPPLRRPSGDWGAALPRQYGRGAAPGWRCWRPPQNLTRTPVMQAVMGTLHRGGRRARVNGCGAGSMGGCGRRPGACRPQAPRRSSSTRSPPVARDRLPGIASGCRRYNPLSDSPFPPRLTACVSGGAFPAHCRSIWAGRWARGRSMWRRDGGVCARTRCVGWMLTILGLRRSVSPDLDVGVLL